jgi:hypothetical protein
LHGQSCWKDDELGRHDGQCNQVHLKRQPQVTHQEEAAADQVHHRVSCHALSRKKMLMDMGLATDNINKQIKKFLQECSSI